MKGSSATMQGNPISIENFLNSNEGSSDSATSSLSEAFTLCFNGIDGTNTPACVYWDDEKSLWSSEGIVTTPEGCCKSVHFSTFGVISPSSE